MPPFKHISARRKAAGYLLLSPPRDIQKSIDRALKATVILKITVILLCPCPCFLRPQRTPLDQINTETATRYGAEFHDTGSNHVENQHSSWLRYHLPKKVTKHEPGGCQDSTILPRFSVSCMKMQRGLRPTLTIRQEPEENVSDAANYGRRIGLVKGFPQKSAITWSEPQGHTHAREKIAYCQEINTTAPTTVKESNCCNNALSFPGDREVISPFFCRAPTSKPSRWWMGRGGRSSTVPQQGMVLQIPPSSFAGQGRKGCAERKQS